jgi:hypothetical protein
MGNNDLDMDKFDLLLNDKLEKEGTILGIIFTVKKDQWVSEALQDAVDNVNN